MFDVRLFIRRIAASKFLYNVAIVATGTAGAQAITIVFAPAITRIYGPEAFGLMGTFVAAAAVVTPIAGLSYPIAIVLPKQDSEAKDLAILSSYVAIGITFIVALFIFSAGDWMVELLNLHSIGSFIMLFPLMMLFSAWLQVAQQWLIRKKLFNISARIAVLHAFLLYGLLTVLGLIMPTAKMLILIFVAGPAIHVLILAVGAKKCSVLEKEHNMKLSKWQLAKQYYDFPLYRTPAGFIHGVSQSLPILLLASFFGPESAGFYTLCSRVLDLPARLISKSVGDVFYPRITEAAHNNENMFKLIGKGTVALVAVGVLPFSFIIASGPWLFGVLFGNEWVVAGEYARWLALAAFFNFINRPCVVIIPVLRLQRFHLIYEIFSLVLKATALLLGILFLKSDLAAVALLGIFGALLYMVLIVYIAKKCRTHQSQRQRSFENFLEGVYDQ